LPYFFSGSFLTSTPKIIPIIAVKTLIIPNPKNDKTNEIIPKIKDAIAMLFHPPFKNFY